MIVLWGTWDVYPKKYKTEFIKGLYDACNHFDEFFAQIDIDMESGKAARYTETQDFCINYPKTVEESIKRNETAHHRIIGLTIETRPEYVTDENCQYWRTLGVTRIEMGIQSLFDDVLDANKRGHSVEQIRIAMHRLRQYAFKVSCHFMPGLYWSTVVKDVATFQSAYDDIRIRPDEQKFYPTAVIPNTELYDLRKSWVYHALSDDELRYITKRVQIDIIPPYTRIKRLARDFDSNEVVAWANTPNLRQLVEIEMDTEFKNSEALRVAQYGKLYENPTYIRDIEEFLRYRECHEMERDYLQKDTGLLRASQWQSLHSAIYTYVIGFQPDLSAIRSFVCLDTRSREVRHDESGIVATSGIVIRQYQSSVGTEYFIAYEDALGYLYGFTRLLLPDTGKSVDREWLGEGTALIRELHVYGQVASLAFQQISPNPSLLRGEQEQTQHTGIGRQLMALAEQIATQGWYDRLSVISGVGVREYYKKLW
jgi:elongator complex protein 3